MKQCRDVRPLGEDGPQTPTPMRALLLAAFALGSLALGSLTLTVVALAQPAARLLFDGRTPFEPAPPAAAELRAVRATVLPPARVYWQKQEPGTEEDFEVLGAAEGAFFGPGRAARAVLYRYSAVPRCCPKLGLAFFEGARLIAHAAYTANDVGLARVADVDGDGRDELLLRSSFGMGGDASEGASLVSVGGGGALVPGAAFDVSGDDCAMGRPGGAMHAARVLVRAGPAPAFVEERFTSACEPVRWRLDGPARPVEAVVAETAFARLPIR